MSSEDPAPRLADAISHTIDTFGERTDITPAAIVGALEAVKWDYLRRCNGIELEDEDEDEEGGDDE